MLDMDIQRMRLQQNTKLQTISCRGWGRALSYC